MTVGRMAGSSFGAGAGESIDKCISSMLSNLRGLGLLISDRLTTKSLQPTCKCTAKDRRLVTQRLRHTALT